MNCPVCEYSNYNGGKCPSCGTDATNLVRLSELPNVYYNKAIELIKKDKLKEAQEALVTAVGVASDDVDSIILLGKVSAEIGEYEKAVLYLNRAVELDKGREEEIKSEIERVEILLKNMRHKEKINLEPSLRKTEHEDRKKGLIKYATHPGSITALVLIVGFFFVYWMFVNPFKKEIENIKVHVAQIDSFKKDMKNEIRVALESKSQKIEQSLAVSEVRKVIATHSISNVFVNENGKIIYLKGVVPTLWDKNRLEIALKEVKGINGLDMRDVEVMYPQGYYYHVKENDSLSYIAETFLGDFKRFEEIYNANKEILRDPSKLPIGIKILIPE